MCGDARDNPRRRLVTQLRPNIEHHERREKAYRRGIVRGALDFLIALVCVWNSLYEATYFRAAVLMALQARNRWLGRLPLADKVTHRLNPATCMTADSGDAIRISMAPRFIRHE